MRELLRDKSRDELTDALNALGIFASMAERGRAEEGIQKPWGKRSLGIIDIPDASVRWINLVKQDGSRYSGPQWWLVFGVPDDASFPAVRLSTARRKSFPLFGRVIGVEWRGDDGGTALTQMLAADPAVSALAIRRGNLEVRRYAELFFSGWTIQVDRRFDPGHEDWAAIERIAEILRSG